MTTSNARWAGACALAIAGAGACALPEYRVGAGGGSSTTTTTATSTSTSASASSSGTAGGGGNGPCPAPCTGDTLWSKTFGDAASQQGNGVATDSKGNVALTGTIQGTVDFGGGPLMGSTDDVFVAIFDKAGAPIGSKRLGDDTLSQSAAAVAFNPDGNLLVTGVFAGDIDLGAQLLHSAGSGDVFVVALSPLGAPLWGKRFGDDQSQEGTSIAVDSAGAALVAGTFDGSIDFGKGPLTSQGSSDAFLVKLDTSGAELWSKSFGDMAEKAGKGVAVDGAKNVFITGYAYGPTDFGGGPKASGGGSDVFLAKLDTDGNLKWGKLFGDASDQIGYGVAADAQGNAVVTGTFQGTIDFGGDPMASNGGQDIFVAKLDAGGNRVWSHRFGDTLDQKGYAVAADAQGNIVVTGVFSGTIDLGKTSLTSVGGADAFALKLDASGDVLWAKRYGGSMDQRGNAVALDASGDALIAGSFLGSIDLGKGSSPASAGKDDIFLAKIAP